MSSSLLKRLDLQSSKTKFDDMLQGVEDVANLPDPAGQTTYARKLDEDLNLYRITCRLAYTQHKRDLRLIQSHSYLRHFRSDWCPPGYLRSAAGSDSQYYLVSYQVRYVWLRLNEVNRVFRLDAQTHGTSVCNRQCGDTEGRQRIATYAGSHDAHHPSSPLANRYPSSLHPDSS